MYEKIKRFILKEKFLSFLLLLYIALLFIDPGLLKKTIMYSGHKSVAVIASFLIISRGFEFSGAFTKLATAAVKLSGGSERKLLLLLIIFTAISSSFVMNDTTIFVFVPVVIALSELVNLDKGMATAFVVVAANVGSSLTPIGNPQNIIIQQKFSVPFQKFVLSLLPYVLTWLAVLLIFTFKHNKKFETFEIPPVKTNKKLLFASTILLILNIIFIHLKMPILGLLFTAAIMLIADFHVVLSIDTALLLLFFMIFIDFKEISFLLSNAGVFEFLNGKFSILIFSSFLSQLLSNVPATVILLNSHLNIDWLPLTIGVNLGGNGFLIGSLANLIALRIAKTSIRKFHKISLPYFLITVIFSIMLLSM